MRVWLALATAASGASGCACPWLVLAHKKGLLVTEENGNFDSNAAVRAMTDGGLDWSLAVISASTGFASDRYLNIANCSSNKQVIHAPTPSYIGWTPDRGRIPADADRFDSWIAAMHKGPGDRVYASDLKAGADWLEANPSPLAVPRPPHPRPTTIPESQAMYIASIGRTDGWGWAPYLTVEDLRMAYVEGHMNDGLEFRGLTALTAAKQLLVADFQYLPKLLNFCA